jgi:hypothetical protein
MRQAAAGLGFPSLVLQARGHEELEVRVTRTYDEFVASGEYTLEVLVLDKDGRITTDYQFIES